MHVRPRRLALALALWPALALAHLAGDEVSVLPVLATPSGAQWTGLSDRLFGEVDLTDFLSARLDVTLSRLDAPPPSRGTPFRSSNEWIGLGTLSVDADVGDHWAFHLDGSWSPASTQQVALMVGALDARLQATSDSYGGGATAGYASGGDSDVEWSVDLVGGWTHYDTTQRIDALETAAGPQTGAQIRADCKGKRTTTCKTLLAALKSNVQALDQGKVGALGSLTLFQNTDLNLAFSYYLYAQDPSSLGDFRVATLGRVSGSGSAPLAPLIWSLRPEVAQRLGRVTLSVAWLHGPYTGDGGFTDSVTLKVAVTLDRWRVWVAVTGNRDVDGSGAVTPSLGGLLGARVRF